MSVFSEEYAKELKAEAPATRKCLERIPPELFGYKPHEKSMSLGYLALLVAEIPKWITTMIQASEIDFATFPHAQPQTTDDLVAHFEENLQGALEALKDLPDEALEEPFFLKNQGQTLFSSPNKINISSSMNHWVLHRGQLTVYMRLNDIPVPAIYGPSADDRGF